MFWLSFIQLAQSQDSSIAEGADLTVRVTPTGLRQFANFHVQCGQLGAQLVSTRMVPRGTLYPNTELGTGSAVNETMHNSLTAAGIENAPFVGRVLKPPQVMHAIYSVRANVLRLRWTEEQVEWLK
jgi:hypothetical protein